MLVRLAILAALAFPPVAQAAVSGIVTSPSGHAVSGARVEAPDGVTAFTDRRGGFTLDADPPAELRVSAAGFVTDVFVVRSPDERLELRPVSVAEEITVTATRTGAAPREIAASGVVVAGRDLRAAASPALDDVLRSVPGFTLFRRSGSRAANPSTQGVSMRGVGASAASRAVVLDDGIPLNDPFGGWVQWGRVPVPAIERVEIVRGGGSDLFGSSALGGAIQLVRHRPPADLITFDGSAGSPGARNASILASVQFGDFGLTASAEALETDGYIPVAPELRGAADARAGLERVSGDLTLERRLASGRLFVRGAIFDEERANGTVLQDNATQLWQGAAGGDLTWRDAHVTFRGFALGSDYSQTFTAVAPDRNSERITRLQDVPSDSCGFTASAARDVLRNTTAAFGIDFRNTRGHSVESAPGSAAVLRSGGSQQNVAAFGELLHRLSANVTASLSVRYDRWDDFDAARSTAGNVTHYDDRSDDAVSPRVNVVARLGEHWSLSGSAYRAFRAPSLNELYRSFRVGDVVTENNIHLTSEKVDGVEAGARFSTARATLRTNLFAMEITDAIANVTVSVTPSLITRQKQNLGATTSRGVELDFETQIAERWSLYAGYLFSDAEVQSFDASPELEGLRIPHVPRHQATLRARWGSDASTIASGELRWVDSQFEDDRNTLVLDQFVTLDFFVSHPVMEKLRVYGAVENAGDARIEVGRTPVLTLGQPRSWRLGVRVGAR